MFFSREELNEIFYDCGHPYLDKDFTMKEVRAILNKLKCRKAPGPDGILNVFLKELPFSWVNYLTSLSNVIFNTGVVPSSWCIS